MDDIFAYNVEACSSIKHRKSPCSFRRLSFHSGIEITISAFTEANAIRESTVFVPIPWSAQDSESRKQRGFVRLKLPT